MAQTKKTKKSNKYWKDRFLLLEESSNRIGMDTYRQIEPAFDKAQREIQNQINIWYSRVAKNNQITIEEAKKLLSAKELKEFHWDVEEYIKYGRENAMNQQWIKELENASARVHISRLEALKIRTQQAAETAFGNELDAIDDMARKVYTEDYYRTIYEMQKGFNIGWEIGEVDQRKLDKLISKPWTADNKTFKDRIWTSKNQMISELHQQLTRTCMLGKSPDEAIEAMTKYVDKDIKNKKYAAGRLVMTEQAYFHSASQKDAFAELDVEKVEIVATLDSHTSQICQDMDGQIVNMKDYEPGVTVPPFHVFCRSVTVPYDEDFEEFNGSGQRAARGEDGKTYYIPDDMTYKEWKEQYVDGKINMMSSPNSEIDLSVTKPIKHTHEELKELKAYANERGFDIYGLKKFDGDSEILKEQIDVMYDLKKEYNYNTPLTIRFEDFDPKDLARTDYNSTTIHFNRCALRDRNLTNAYLNEDDYLSATDVKGIGAHEMGHKLYEKYGNIGLDIAKETCYNITGKIISDSEVINFLSENVSEYSTVNVKGDFREIISEILGKNATNPDEFTTEFTKLLKERWKI